MADRHEQVTGAGDESLAGLGDVRVVEPGTSIGGYVVEELVGRGGMGVVYRARDPELGRSVALKLIHPELADRPGFRELFIRESLVAASLEHPGVLPVYRAGHDAGHLFIAMRFVDGESLAELVRRHRRLPAGRAARIVARVADALDAAHARRFVHRDVKPANILIADPDGDEHVYLTDFGISTSAGESSLPRSSLTGTPAYASPEQRRGERVEAAGDTYSLGCVLFFALTGEPPDDADVEPESHPNRMGQPTVLPAGLPGIPPAMDDVIRRALAPLPDDRFVSSGAFGRAALDARFDLVLAHSPGTAAETGAIALQCADNGLQVVTAVSGDSGLVLAAGACGVVIGPDGLGEWARDLLANAVDVAGRDRAFRLFAIVVPGGPDPQSSELAFFRTRPWVDLRGGLSESVDQVIQAVRGAVPPALGVSADTCPYRGLESYDEEHADLFVGREVDERRILTLLAATRFVAVIGPSGSGKSSLVGAGVLPAVRAGALPGSDRWLICVLRPGSQPLEALASQLRGGDVDPANFTASARALDEAVARRLAGRPEDERVLFVVDQFEELYTLCADPIERRAFLDNLSYATTIPGGRSVALITLRADFYHRTAEHPELRILVSTWQHLVGAMDAATLRRVIEEPAVKTGATLEPGLTRRIVTDVVDRPGTLPLLSHVLEALWMRRRGRILTLAGYEASGGVRGALARTAEAAYGTLEATQQEVARRILLRLTQPGEGVEDTRRQATVKELTTGTDSVSDVEAVIGRLSDARLLSVDSDAEGGAKVVDVAHEALIGAWPRLKAWIDEDREALRMHRRLADAAREWERADKDDGLLARGAWLGLWDDADLAHLNTLERAYLDASRDRQAADSRARQRRLRGAFAALAVAAIALGSAAAFGFVQRSRATDQRDLARSRQLAASARLQLESDPELSLLLALEANRATTSPEADELVRLAVSRSTIRASHRKHAGTVRSVAALAGETVVSGGDDGAILRWAFDGDPIEIGRQKGSVTALAASAAGTVVSAGADGTVRVWGGSRDGRVLRGHDGPVNDVAISRSGDLIVSGGDDGTVRVWRAKAKPVVLRGHTGGVAAVAMSPDGRTIASAGRDDFSVRTWSVDGGGATTLMTATQGAFDVGFSPDGTRIVAAFGDNTARIVPVGTPHPVRRLVASSLLGVNGARYSEDGQLIVTAGGDGRITIWRANGVRMATLRGHAGRVYDATFDRSGRYVVSAGEDGSVRVWDWAATLPRRDLASPVDFPIEGGGTFDSTGTRILSVGLDASLRSWDISSASMTSVLAGGPANSYVNTAALSPDQTTLVVSRPDGTLEARSTLGPDHKLTRLAGDGVPVWTLAFRPDGRAVAAGRDDGKVAIWEVGSNAPVLVNAHSGPVNGVAFDHSGAHVASAGADGRVKIVDVSARSVTAELVGHEGPALAVAISPDGRQVASGGRDRTVRLWSVAGGPSTVLRGHASSVNSVVFSSGGDRLLSVSDDHLRIWDFKAQVPLFQVDSATRQFYKAVFGPRDETIAVQTLDRHVLVYDCETCVSHLSVVRLAGERVTRGLSAAERETYRVPSSP